MPRTNNRQTTFKKKKFNHEGHGEHEGKIYKKSFMPFMVNIYFLVQPVNEFFTSGQGGSAFQPYGRYSFMRILHLISGRSFTGPAASALTDVQALLAVKPPAQKAWLGSRSGTALESGCAEKNVPYLGGFKLGRGPGRLLRLPADIRRLRQVIREEKIEIVHLHRSDELMLAQLANGKAHPFKIVRTWHRDPAEVSKAILHKLVKGCDAHICVSTSHEATLREAHAEHVTYLSPGVNTSLFQPRSDNAPIDGVIALGLIGRWKSKEDRGQKTLISLASKLDPRLKWKVVLLGRGEAKAELESLIATQPNREHITLTETTADFPKQVANLDLGLVFKSGSDGSSRAAVELLASGVPILVADRPGLRELATDTLGARVLPADNLDVWTQTLKSLLSDVSELKKMKSAARDRAEKEHALSVHGQKLKDIYARILGG